MSPRGRRGGGARSEDDRQRARLEREQRRAQREGRPVPRSIDDLPVGEPSIDPAGLGLPGAPRPGATPGPGPGGSSGTDQPGAGEGTAAPAADEDPRTRRARLAQLRGGTSPVTDPGADTEVRHAAAPAPGTSARPSDTGDRPPASRAERSGSGQPWWATAGTGDAPPPAAGASRPRPASSPAAAPEAPAVPRDESSAPRPRVPAARRDPSPAQDPPTPADRRDATPAPRPLAPADPRADPPTRRPSTPTADARISHDPGPIRAPGAVGPSGAAPRGRGAGEPGRPAARETEDWFGPERTEDTDGQQAAAAAEPALVPLRPAGPARPSGTAPATVHTRTAPSRRGVSRIAAFLVLVPFVVVIAAVVFLFQPFKGDGEGEVRVRIPPGSSVDDIGKLLKERDVVSNSLAFAIRARLSGDGANLKAGTLRLKRGMSYGAALTALQQDPLPPSVIRVSIPEGLSRSETASSIKKAGVTGSYLTASSRASGFDPTDFGQPRARRGLEGFLFPATYELQRGGATAKDLVDAQLKSFRTNFAKVSMRRARRAKLSPYEVLIVASMIEREVRVPSERKLVAAVIWNRLEQDIALGIDATTRYAVKNWTRPLRQSEIDRDTPYDTRRKKGLPPTPIGSPGLSAIRAAANPANEKYLFYVVRPCSDGRHNFASTDAEFQKDVATYNAAQRRAGGDPSPKDAKGCRAG